MRFTSRQLRKRAQRKSRQSATPIKIEAGAVPSCLTMQGSEPVELVAAAGDEETGPRKFKGLAYSGGLMRPRGFYRDVVLDLSGTKLASGSRPILHDHDPRRIVGHSESIDVAQRRVSVSGLISGTGEAAQEVCDTADNGFPWRLSVGAAIHKINFIPEGESIQANGRKWQGPIYVVRAATINEISFVSLAGDDRTNASIAAGQELGEGTMTFEQWLEAAGWDINDLTATQRIQLKAAYDAEQLQAGGNSGGTDSSSGTEQGQGQGDRGNTDGLNAGSGVDDLPNTETAVADLRAATGNELTRQQRIQELCAQYGNPTITVGEGDTSREINLHAHAVSEGWDHNQTELHALRASRQATPFNIHSRNGTRTPEALCAALSLSAGIAEDVVARDISEQQMNAAMSSQYRDATLHVVMDQVIASAGMHFSGNRKSNEFIRCAMRAERQLMAGGEGYSSLNAAAGFSTLSLSGILGNTAHKAMIQSYDAVEVVHPEITAPRSHTDFKAWSRFRLDATGAFKKVGPDGELKQFGLAEASYTNQLETFGAIIALTRQMIINDDLGAFLQIPSIIGRLAAVKREEETFVLLLSNPGNFFHSDNGNLFTGGASALSIDALTTAESMFGDQVDSNGKPILHTPSILLSGTPLHVTAKNLHDETKVSLDTNSRDFASNPHVGKFKPVKSPYINNTKIKDSNGNSISGQSSSKWHLFTNPAVRAAIGMASLNGRTMPTIESDETDFTNLGMQWRGYDDFGVGMEDPTAALEAAGQ